MKNVLFKQEFTTYVISEHENQTDINKINEEKTKPFTVHNLDYYVKNPIFQYVKSYHDEDTFQKNIKNPLYSLSSTKVLVVVEEIGEKISFKLFTNYFEKRVGNQWFKRTKHVNFLTVNRKTGDVYNGFIHNYQNKKKFQKRIRRNYFSTEPLSVFVSNIKNLGNSYLPNSSEVANEAANIFIDSIIKTDVVSTREQKLFKFYLDKKGFKYPNNFDLYRNVFSNPQFKKILKKNGKKLVDALMIQYGVRGKKIKKYLHECKQLNVENLQTCLKLFGEEWLSQHENAILNVLNYEKNFPPSIVNLKEHLSKEELKRVFKMITNSVCNNEIDVWTFADHARMYLELKEYGENDIKWSLDGGNYSEFSKEHLDWTDKIEHYKRGTYERIYPKYFIDKIQSPIEDYFPVILMNSNDYNSESLIQSNCVKTYIGRPSSFIISLRNGSDDSKERITIEYRIVIEKNSGKIFSDRIQTLGRYNKPIDDSWNDVLFKLDEKVLSCHQDPQFESVKIKKECSNGVILQSDSHFDEDGILRWSHKKENFGTYIW